MAEPPGGSVAAILVSGAIKVCLATHYLENETKQAGDLSQISYLVGV